MGLGLRATTSRGEVGQFWGRRTNALLVPVFSWDLLTMRKVYCRIMPALSFKRIYISSLFCVLLYLTFSSTNYQLSCCYLPLSFPLASQPFSFSELVSVHLSSLYLSLIGVHTHTHTHTCRHWAMRGVVFGKWSSSIWTVCSLSAGYT